MAEQQKQRIMGGEALVDPDIITIDFTMARALVRLRFAQEHAIALGRDSSEAGAQIAIVALDGAVEYALRLVARDRAVKLRDRASRHDLLTGVRDALGAEWRPNGADGVDQLHRARNDVQHASVMFDASQVPDWSAAAAAFIESLVEANFGAPLSEVSLADAVRDEAIAEHLRRAEMELARAEAGASLAFQLVSFAFDEARGRWREQQAHIYGQPFLEHRVQPIVSAVDGLGPVVPQEERLADFLEVVPFANDLGEYSWFVGASRQHEAGWDPGVDEARRALVFVSGWIVRWEIFVRGYPQERWEKFWDDLAPPVVGDGTNTEVLGLDIEMSPEFPGHPSRCVLTFRLANVPDRARGPWGHWIPQALFDSAQELAPDIRFNGVSLTLRGELILICDLGYDPGALATVIKHAIERTDARFCEYEQSEAERTARTRRLQGELNALLDSARTGPELFDSVEVTERQDKGTADVWLSLNLVGAKHAEIGHCANIFRDVRGPLTGTAVFGDRLTFGAFELTEDNRELLNKAIYRCEEFIFDLRERHAMRVDEFSEFAAILRGHFIADRTGDESASAAQGDFD